MKRIEVVKNRVKTELKKFVQIVDVKQQKFAEIFDKKHKEIQQALAKRKRLSDIWVSFDRLENDLLNQEIRTFRTLDEIDFFVGLNESEPVGSEKMCYDLSLRQGRFAGNVCQNLNLAIWANVQNVQTHWERQERLQRSKRVRRS